MAYLDQDDPDLLHDLKKRKEFYWTKKWHIPKRTPLDDIIPTIMLEREIRAGRYLRLQGHQIFISNFLNPNTYYRQLHLLWNTGSGKTIGALTIAMRFIERYRISGVGTVFVIGFSERQFKSELLSFPEFGFLSREEKVILSQLKAAASIGGSNDIDRYREYIARIKRRLTSRKGNGFFKFYGYKAFFNRILIVGNLDISAMNEEEIRAAINDGRITINQQLLAEFKNSLILCDEIHNVYNSVEKNNWGIAIQLIMDKEKSCRLVTMSATPINNSPSELIDLLNILQDTHLNKSDFFEVNGVDLKPGALEKLENYCRGRFSYISDQNPKYYPRIEYEGERDPNIPYLSFIQCKLNPSQKLLKNNSHNIDIVIPDPNDETVILHSAADIKNALMQASPEWKKRMGIIMVGDTPSGDILAWNNVEKIWPKGRAILDYLYERIAGGMGKVLIYHNDVHVIGVKLIQQLLVMNGFLDEYSLPSGDSLCYHCGKSYKNHKEFKDKRGGRDSNKTVNSDKNAPGKSRRRVVSPNLFSVSEREGVVYLSAPRQDLVDFPFTSKELPQFLALFSGSVVVSISRTHDKLIACLEKESFITQDRNTNPVILKKVISGGADGKFSRSTRVTHNSTEHTFLPVRYAMAHSEIDKSRLETSLDRFNSTDNIEGQQCMILVGSRLIKESYDLKAIQNILIVERPPNIPTLIQIRGRGVRKDSHAGLPEEKQVVRLAILVNSEWERSQYKKKVHDYQVIQKIEQMLHRVSIDEFLREEAKGNDPLGDLPWKRSATSNMEKDTALLTTFYAFHGQEEINIVKMLIKRLFIEISHVWKVEELFNAVRHPPLYYDIAIDTSTITRESFMIALSTILSWESTTNVDSGAINMNILLNRIFDPSDKIIVTEDLHEHVVQRIGDYLILFPYIGNTVIQDVDLPYRIIRKEHARSINIHDFVINKRVDFDYGEKIKIFHDRYLDTSIEYMRDVVCEFGPAFHQKFLEECIEYVFRVWTDPTLERHEYHEFYFKMLYYYDLLSLVMWAHTCKPRIFKEYLAYAIPVHAKDIKLKTLAQYKTRDERLAVQYKNEIADISPDDSSDLASSGVINMLKSTYNKTSNAWIPEEFRNAYIALVNKSLDLFQGRKKRARTIVKVSADLLPIGHYISRFPRIYIPKKGWDENPTYLQNEQNYIENDVIIGFDERSDTGVHIRFKIRKPIHNIKSHKDAREIEKGTVCKSKSKEDLLRFAKGLGGIIPEGHVTLDDLCVIIRTKLIRKELVERIAGSKIKWFYFHYEERPELKSIKKTK